MKKNNFIEFIIVAMLAVYFSGCATTKTEPAPKSKTKKASTEKAKNNSDASGTQIPSAPPIATSANAAAVSPELLAPRAGKIWISRPDGSKSCGVKKGVTPREAARELEAEGVHVIRQRIGHDGQMRMMVCGADTGNLLELLIDGEGLPAASKKGFRVKGED